LRLTRVFPSRLYCDFPCHSSSPRSAHNNCTEINKVSASKQESWRKVSCATRPKAPHKAV
jgi:hypothetical protein